ncbi:hypothetical protein [Acidomonas methanolica]|uniref:hypothetical protein n=1 Tax=Acidomonas methanolica TaxID=437 RepID=UPI002119FCD8|nr:hypothetical protein [Acidomonas methanolica]
MRDAVMEPTPERLARDGFRRVGATHRVLGTVQVLREAGDIGDEEVAAAERWSREYVLASLGVVDRPAAPRPDALKGDVHSWMLNRGKCAARLSRIRETLGLAAHVRLEMMLGREMSFSAMARCLYPDLSEARARMKVSAQSAFLLEMLAHFYGMQKKNRE